MCGIAGYWSRTHSGEEVIRAMTSRIAHRGPDAGSTYTDSANGFSLGHRRLSIIDLSDAANQPFLSDDGRYALVFNGEIYNYQELRQEHLSSESFRTSSDTEVILRLFLRKGESFVSLLNGMFAFAIYDSLEKKAWIYRDRIGIKPLYYADDGRTFAFASELKSLEAIPDPDLFSFNHRAINVYLHLGYIPEPDSIYTGIKKFPAGHYLKWENGNTMFFPYWKPAEHYQSKTLSNETQALNELKTLLESSVKYRMIADVPFGTFLSGGVDSSAVTAIASTMTSKLATFSIGFAESTHNEALFAQKIAHHLGTDHTEFTVTEKEALELVPQLTDVYDEPFADSSSIPTMMVSKLARDKVKMVLTGDGGDELFMGYGSYRWARRMNNPVLWQARKLISTILWGGSPRQQRAALVFKAPDKSGLKAHIFSQEQYLFSKPEIPAMLTEKYRSAFSIDAAPPSPRKLSSAELQSFFDLNYYLKDDLLVKVDRATMRYGLEARVPLLDYRIVEWSLNLDERLKHRNGTSKYILKKLLYQYLPETYFQRSKWGFAIPLHSWLANELRPFTADYLSPEAVKTIGVLEPKAVNQLMLRYLGGKTYLYNRVWTLLMLQQFLFKIKK